MGEYLYPYGLSFSQAYHYQTSTQTSVPMPNMAEAILTEQWSANTGVRRVLSGVDIQNFEASYRPKLQSGEGDMFLGQAFVTDLCDWSLEFFSNSVRYDSIGNMGQPAGLFSFTRPLDVSEPSGSYELRLTVKSINVHGNTEVESRYLQVDRSIVNQRPTISNIWFPSGDSCVLLGQPVEIAATATDPDGSVVLYDWYTDPDGLGEFDQITPGRVNFTLTTPLMDKAEPHFLKVKVTDNYGQQSLHRQLTLDPIDHEIDFYCICTWMPGDANWSHTYSISDVVSIRDYIFASGSAPRPVVMAGDANCDHTVSISDMVYLVAYIFQGGPAPPCTCQYY